MAAATPARRVLSAATGCPRNPVPSTVSLPSSGLALWIISGAVVLVVEEGEGGGGDRADAPGAEADSAQRLEPCLQQRVAAFGWCADTGVQRVDGALVDGERAAPGPLDRRDQHISFAFVAQVGQHGVDLVGPLGQQRQRLGVGTQRGGVVLPAGPHG